MKWPQAVPMNQAVLPRLDSVGDHRGFVRVVIPYTDPATTRAALSAAGTLTRGLNASIALVAVQVLPFPAPFYCPSSISEHLEARLTELAAGCTTPVDATVVLARDTDEGYRQVLLPGATVLIATRKRWWRTREEKLARALTRAGHKVAVVELDRSGVAA